MSSIDDRLADLRAVFLVNSRRKLAEIDALFVVLERDAGDLKSLSKLDRLFHGFAGIGRTYGFPEITERGAMAERLIGALVGGVTPSPGDLAALRSHARAIAETLAQGHVSISLPDTATPLPERPGELLVVSPDSAFADTITNALSREGFVTIHARTLEEGRQRLGHRLPDAFIADIEIGGRAAYDLVEELRSLPYGNDTFAAITSVATGFVDKVEAIRCGADLYIEKPVDSDVLLRRLRRARERLHAAPGRVLSVEDDPDQAVFLRSTLEAAGYEVRICDHPSAFERAVHEFRPDLVLMDIVLPGDIKGYDLARYLRQQDEYASLPVVFLSTESRIDAAIASIRSGGDDHLTKPVSSALLVSSVATRIERSRVLRDLLLQDGLTGLLTHSAFSERMRTAAIERRRRPNVDIALVMLDLDHFKQVNDSYGHPVGDRVLASLAQILRRRLRRSDSIGRYGGEEFAFMLSDIHSDDAVRLTERLLEEFAAVQHMAPGGLAFEVTFSAGLSMLRKDDDAESWKRRADEALYEAKRRGRARVIAV